MPNVLSLDLALHTGYAIKVLGREIKVGIINVAKYKTQYERMEKLSDAIYDLVIENSIEMCVIESPAIVFRNSVFCTYSLHSIVFFALRKAGVRVFHYPASAWRKVLSMKQRGRDIMKVESISRACEMLNCSDIDENSAEALLMLEAWIMDGRKAYEVK